MDESREAELIRAVLAGDPHPFEVLVRRYQGPVYNLMLRNAGDGVVAEDLAQEAFIRAYSRLETFRLGKRFFPWLYALSMNVVRDWLRKNGRDFHVFMEQPSVMVRDEDRPDVERSLMDRLDGARAFEAVLELPPAYREALILRFRHDLSMAEVARALDISVSGAKMRVSRGLDMLRSRFKEETDEY